MTIVDATRLDYAEVLPGEKQPTTVDFLIRAVAWFDSQGNKCRWVLSEKDSAYRSNPWHQACEVLGQGPSAPSHTHQEATASRTLIKTLLNEWAYGLSVESVEERNRWLSRSLAIYNGRRCHMALAGLTPFQQLRLQRATE